MSVFDSPFNQVFRNPYGSAFNAGAGGGAPADPAVYHVVLYGQSLANGTDPDGASVLTADPVTGHYMPNGGVRFHYDTPLIANVNTYAASSQFASLATLEEQLDPNDADLGETFAAGMALNMTSKGLFTSTARNAFKVSELNRTAAYHFPNTQFAVQAARDLCDAAELPYSVGLVLWKQGEADGAVNTSKATYKSAMITLRQDLENAFDVANMADVGTLPLVMDQLAISATGSVSYHDIAVAAIELHRETAGFYCAGPTYQCSYTAINDVHFTSVGYRNYGEKLGQVAQSIIDGDGWEPCHITGVSRSGTTITVNVHVPFPPLVVDTTLVASKTDKGFTYTGATITDVTITDDGTTDNAGVITITINSGAGGTLGYAYRNYDTSGYVGPVSGARGNIRDSDPFVTQYDGSAYPNWLCVDAWSVA